ncbi:CD48 antigen-like [Betta splendens]|uniref:CD48 antigen-like n=1 Tax=Betta splendens TaxID=158456 RepID=A0A6P7L2Q3_BETSP|nr:CD48 antigen-like [Betta splendens]
MDHRFQGVILLFLSYHIQASRAVTSVFVKKGRDVQLDVKEDDVAEDFLFLAWRVNGKHNLVLLSHGEKPTLYTDRVEFSVTNCTMKLKNLQETDSGDYTAVVLGAEIKVVAEYKVTVQDPVSPVSLTVDSVSNSSDSCNVTVTCRTQDSHISTTFTCVKQICSEDGDRAKATTSGAVLHVYLDDDSIKCNHSNQVSWTTNQGAKIQEFCHQSSETLSAGFPLCLVKMVVFSVGLIIMTSAVITVNLIERTMKRKLTQEYFTSVSTQNSY